MERPARYHLPTVVRVRRVRRARGVAGVRAAGNGGGSAATDRGRRVNCSGALCMERRPHRPHLLYQLSVHVRRAQVDLGDTGYTSDEWTILQDILRIPQTFRLIYPGGP